MTAIKHLSLDAVLPKTGRIQNEESTWINIADIIADWTEEITKGIKVINTDHAAIHDGIGMCASLYLPTLAPAAIQNYRYKGPTSLFAHIKSIQVNGQGSALKVELIRSTVASPIVITNVGTEIVGAIQNLNDNSDKVPESKLYDSGIVFTGGANWCSVIVNGSSTNQAVTGGSFAQGENQEYVTKDGDTDYILKITNLDGSDTASYIGVNMFFYEEPQGLDIE